MMYSDLHERIYESEFIIRLYPLRFDIQLINKGIDFIGILNENCPSNTWYAHERAQKNRQKKYPISLLWFTGVTYI